ncbi:MAG: pentapeptide repeat-containing protein [Scytonema sp. CRU_2_7]|nr:pentapeptide repeat-containing protein [Scytonema sp. CRU_2_7]
MRGACLEVADLRGACLEGANLTEANLDGADLTGVDLGHSVRLVGIAKVEILKTLLTT